MVIRDHTAAEIRTVAARVFHEDGYEAYTTGGGGMTFEKEGSRRNQLAHGGLISTQERVRKGSPISLATAWGAAV